MDANPNAGTNIQIWQDFSEDQAQQVQDQVDKGSTDFWKAEEGENIIRVFPALAGGNGRKTPLIPIQSHFFEAGVLLENIVSFNCPRLMAGQRCPSCEEADRLRRSGDQSDFEQARIFIPGPAALGVILDRKHPDKGGQPTRFNKTVTTRLTELRQSKTLGGNWADPTANGYDVVIVKKTAKKGTGTNAPKKVEYTIGLMREKSPLHPDSNVMMELLKTQPPIEMFAAIPSYEAALAKMKGEKPPEKKQTAAAEQKQQAAPAARWEPVPETAGQNARDVTPAQQGFGRQPQANVAAAAETGPDEMDIPF